MREGLVEFRLYNNTIKIYFDPDPIRHIFYDAKMRPLISVTAATGIVDKSAPLMFWAVNLAKHYLINNWDIKKKFTEAEKIRLIEEASKQHRIFKKEAADIGTLIHQWVSEWIKGKNSDIPNDDKVANGITAFLKFNRDHKVKWLESERIVYSKKYNYAGILDATGKIGRDLVLTDFKSSNGIYDEMRFQVAGYQIAYEEETGKKFDRTMIIRFGKDTGEFEAFELDNQQRDKKAFLACLEIKRRLKELSRFNEVNIKQSIIS